MLADAWGEFSRCPSDRDAKSRLVHMLGARPRALGAAHAPLFLRLLNDRDVDPNLISRPGWQFLLHETDLFVEWQSALEAFAQRLEEHDLARALLASAPVHDYNAEEPLTGLRRWLLLSGTWAAFPRLAEALRQQAVLNQGAWLIEADERAELNANALPATAALYSPAETAAPSRSDLDDPVTRAVAEQYERWPCPQWTRVLAGRPGTLAADIRAWDPDGPDTIPRQPEILIAGCGTGKHAARFALQYPDARITAVDISAASLRVADARCRELGISGIEFRQLDLHRLADLNRRFDAISSIGVLHHFPDPEAGWEALVAALKPAGVLHLGVYSKLGRLGVQRLRAGLGDIQGHRHDSEFLRQVRRRIIERFRHALPSFAEFYTLGGILDLLAHRHEDPFDVARIKRAMNRFDLTLLRFGIRTPDLRAAYEREFPGDSMYRDFDSWSAFEKMHPRAFSTMYRFWCRRRS